MRVLAPPLGAPEEGDDVRGRHLPLPRLLAGAERRRGEARERVEAASVDPRRGPVVRGTGVP